jgi:hypothetical protein
MGNKPRSLAVEIGPAWHEFLTEALPFGLTTQAAAAVNGVASVEARRRFANSPAAKYLRKLRSGGVGQPEPETVWNVAAAAQTLAGNEWCAAPLFLFAAGHFAEFAIILTRASEKLISRERKATLVSAARTACAPRNSAPQDLKALLIDAGISETIAHQELRLLQEAQEPPARPDRNAWILEPAERASFEDGFRRLASHARDSEQSSPIVTCRLAALHPEIGLSMQRDIVLTSLLNAVRT